MAKTILFSPIGGNDPVSSSNESDGSMLHICRHYKPDIVYLYLSAEMVKRSRSDHRYEYCIEKLGAKLKHQFEVHMIERETLEAVHDYDFYYKEFHEIIGEIENTMEPEDRLLINIASGTPAMKSELLVAAVLSEFHSIPIQVVTPTGKINQHSGDDLDYDKEYYWELNKDNEKDAPNRCIEVKCPNLVATIKKNIISRHLLSYDYTAALTLAEEIRYDIPEVSIKMIEAAIARLQLDLPKVNKLENTYGFRIKKRKTSTEEQIIEYALSLQIKLVRREFADYIRAISPLLTDLFAQVLKHQFGIDIIKYCSENNKVQYLETRQLASDQRGKEILSILNEEFNGYKDKALAASVLKPILVYYSGRKQDLTIVDDVASLRYIEERLRNLLAHEIIAFDDEKLQRLQEITDKKELAYWSGKYGQDLIKKLSEHPVNAQQILGIIKRLIVKSGVKATKEEWNSYDMMNQTIIDSMYLTSN